MSTIQEKTIVQEINQLLLEELAAEIVPPPEPDEVTARMLADYANCTVTNAKELLDGKVRAGLMTSRRVRHEGHLMMAYKKAPPLE
jgi:hypothetical protein